MDEMTRAIIAADETTQFCAQNVAMKVVAAHLVACLATQVAVAGQMTATEFVNVFKREGTNALLADGFADGNPALEVLRVQAVKALAEFCDPIAKGLENYEPPSSSAAETSQEINNEH